jgi:hypothetical protein
VGPLTEMGCDRAGGRAEGLTVWALLPSGCTVSGCTLLNAVGVEYKNLPAIKVVKV